MIRQPQRRLYFESETEEYYWDRSKQEAGELADKLGYAHVSGLGLRKLSGKSLNEPERNDPKTSDTASIGDVRGRQGY